MGLETGSSIEPALGEDSDFNPRTESRGGLKKREELNRENEVLRDRIARLNAASLRISTDLIVATVLTKVMESAQ